MKNLLILIIGILSIVSCESLLIKDIDIDDTGFEKQLVVQSFIEANTDSIVAFISENESILTPSEDIKFIVGAVVRVYYDGGEIAKLEEGDDGRYYHFLNEPITGRGAYEIRVADTPYKDARATTTIPEDQELSDLEFVFDAGTDALDMSSVSEVSFVINDPPGKNYYTISIDASRAGLDTFYFDGDTLIEQRYISTYPASTQLDPSISATGYGRDYVINDDFFDGQRKKVSLRFILSYWTSSDGFEDELREGLKLTLTTHSADSYNYITSLNAYWDARDFGFFSEPVSVYGNIENGLGIFAGQSKKVYRFK